MHLELDPWPLLGGLAVLMNEAIISVRMSVFVPLLSRFCAPLPKAHADLYCVDSNRRGQAENYIKNFKRGLDSECMSCERFVANHGRLLIYGLAYLLMMGWCVFCSPLMSRSRRLAGPCLSCLSDFGASAMIFPYSWLVFFSKSSLVSHAASLG